jgi:hypothetical protein
MVSTITFSGKSFCFTGNMAELKRTQAEREVRSRLGLSQKIVNPQLDYLVIGSIPSIGWKHGDYGNKIEKARQLLKDKNSKLKLVSEHDFILGLENIPVSDSGEIDEKLLVVRYTTFVSNGEFDLNALEDHLRFMQETAGCHVNVSIEEPYIYKDLYNQYAEKDLNNLLLIRCRLVKHLPLDFHSQLFVDDIARGFEIIKGLDGEITFSEKKEGTASFSTLLKTIPQKIKL